jgi:GNAT superfamily N-acetyltransferase
MRIDLEHARPGDAAAIAALREASARQLTRRFGPGDWSVTNASLGGVEKEIEGGDLYVGRLEEAVIATLRLATRNPWIGDTAFFTERPQPLYLTSMAVLPPHQGQGVGRACIEAVKRIAAERGAGAIRLDAFDAPAGAGGFYAKCGFREAHRADYFDTPLIWFECLL